MSNSGRVSLRDHHCNHPSFSFTLLEDIYRSFDDEYPHNNHRIQGYRMMKKSNSSYLERDNRFIVDQWIKNENRNLSQTDGKFHHRQMNYSSSTSSSDCSSVIRGFYSSDTDSLYGYSSKSKERPPGVAALKPNRTAVNSGECHRKSYSDEFPAAKKIKEGNLQRRALKLYGDLKKVKQPISPGGKLATFFNSLFNSGASKKPKSSPSPVTPSPVSRSCLSKTSSSAGRIERRSVRFVDDDRRHVRAGGVDVAMPDSSMLADELLKNYRNNRKSSLTVNVVPNHGRKFDNDVNIRSFSNNEEEEDDVSCCSSDLFELENLQDVGVVDRYGEELPVYETTHVKTNRAIANGYIL